MITMYASVANRTPEIGTLRALGFRRGSILWAFLLESLLHGRRSAAWLGVALRVVHAVAVVLDHELPVLLRARVLLHAHRQDRRCSRWCFALLMGLLGGFLPAIRAARLKIVDALRAA